MLIRAIRHGIERKRAEKALQGSEARFHTLVEKSADGIVIVAQDSVVRFVNPAAEALFGRQANELVSQVGLGTLNLVEANEERRRWTFTGDGLVERRTESSQPTCSYARGFLCGAVAHVLGGKRVSGVEMACQSMGDELCRFVVQVVGE